MQYTIRSLSSDEAFETLAAHVLARAYLAAWRARHGSEPSGPHVIEGLDLVIEFQGEREDHQAAPDAFTHRPVPISADLTKKSPEERHPGEGRDPVNA